MNIEQQMRNALTQGADQLQLPQAGPGAVRERARKRARRRQVGTGGATALVLVLAAVAMWQYLPQHEVRFEEGGGVADGGRGSRAAHALDNLDWRETDGVVGQNPQILHSADGVYYALSTAPDTRAEDHPDGAVPQALYRSTDGVSWDVADLGEEPWVADLGEREGVLYAVSTAPATNPAGSGRQVGTSRDGGRTWTRADLPSAAAPDADVGLQGPVVRAQMAVGQSLMLAWTSSTYRIDGEDVFSADELEGAYVRHTPEGVALIEHSCREAAPVDPDTPRHEPADDAVVPEPASESDVVPSASCRAGDEHEQRRRTVPWEELGLGGGDDLRVGELLRSTDGDTWEALETVPFAGRDVQELTAGPHGFFAITRVQDGDDGTATVELLRSADGTSWEQVDGAGPVTTLGFVGERIVGTASHGNGRVEAVASDDGGATWTRTDLVEVAYPNETAQTVHVSTQATGPLGAAVVMVAQPDGPPSSERGVPEPATTPAADRVPAERLVLTSADGITWAVTPLADVVGEDLPSAISWVSVGDDAIVLSAAWPRGSERAVPTTRTFVGTPVR